MANGNGAGTELDERAANAAVVALMDGAASGDVETDGRAPAPRRRRTSWWRRSDDSRRVTVRSVDLDNVVQVLNQGRSGNFAARVPVAADPAMVELGMRVNDLVAMNERMQNELERVGRAVGQEGRINERAALSGAGGGWQSSVEAVNGLVDDLMRPTTEVARVLDAVAKGDLTRKMALTIEGQPVKGEYLRIGTTVNEMVDQLSSFTDEVTRVAREVGTEGRLGGQADVRGVSGTWKDLTDNVNLMASNLTDQVRSIAEVTTAVARGDLSRKVTINVRGEIAELKDTINTMVDQLSSFTDEVTRVAREVGTEGRLGGQAEVRGVS
ncbi:MAG: two-component hybrid sensor and regulator, partial [Thermoleophilia bacterium]|nr:two-component hybrid sensor and regulator [Thermoleophilia bacterium]